MEQPAPDTATRRTDPARVEAYVEGLFAREDAALLEIRGAMARRELPTIQVPPTTGRLLQVLLRATGARRVLEVGTLGGYSALWMVRGLPREGRLLTLERDPERAALARDLLEAAGEADRVEVREGNAREILPALGPDGTFDALFLDADKPNLLFYLHQAERLLRPGGLLLVDNALWRGSVLDPGPGDPDTEALRAISREVAAGSPWTGTLVPVGDGVLVAVRS
jgi:caffeoyl-CoA O-methyltransferase